MFIKVPAAPDEIYNWLCSFANLERGLGGAPGAAEHFKLDRMKALADLAGNPENCAPVIHIAGSKGKGSVCALIASVLEAAPVSPVQGIPEGIKTARYMSPHVSDWRERISRGTAPVFPAAPGVTTGFFPEAVYAAAAAELRELYQAYCIKYGVKVESAGKPGPTGNGGDLSEPTFFELFTLYFFLCARRDGAEYMVVETGLGGRLDATNIVNPAVSVITPIEKEHTEYLGNTLRAIALEKAGIIKPGRPVIAARQEVEVLEVLRRTAEERAAPFYYLPETAEALDCRVRPEGTEFRLRFRPGFPDAGNSAVSAAVSGDVSAAGFSGGMDIPGLIVSMPGKVYAENAALAAAALVLAGVSVRAGPACGSVFGPGSLSQGAVSAFRRGFQAAALPARFERLCSNPPFIVDGAHTPASVSRCAETFCALYGREGILLFGCAADKNASAMAELLVPFFSRCIITGTGTFRKGNPASVYAAFRAVYAKTHTAADGAVCGLNGGAETEILAPPVFPALIPNPTEAVQEALRLSRTAPFPAPPVLPAPIPVLCCGSFYLAAEVRGTIRSSTDSVLP